MPERRTRGRLPKLDPLPHDLATALCAIGTPRAVAPGALLYQQGDPADRLFAIENGYAKITSQSPDGHQVVVAFIGPRYTIGVAGMYVPHVYTFNAVAATPMSVSVWTRAQAKELVRHPALRHYLDQLVYHYMEVLAMRLHTLSDGLIVERLAAMLLELAIMHGHGGDYGGIVEIDPPVTYEDLAGLTGTTLESVNRTLTRWREVGAVLARSGKGRIGSTPIGCARSCGGPAGFRPQRLANMAALANLPKATPVTGQRVQDALLDGPLFAFGERVLETATT